MAKGKINALVTVEEQPYSVPENWNWFYLGALSEVMCDGVHYAPEYLNSGIPCFSAKDIYDDDIHLDKCNFISNDEYEGMKSKINVKDNSLLVTKSGSIGRTAIVEKAYPFGLVESIGVVNTKYVSVHYVKRLLDMGFVYSSEFLEQYTTGTTIKHLTLRLLANIKVPLPPEAEQQRIVDRIESLFAKLDEAKEKAQAVVDGFEDRKAAILHKAFTGELTAEWRKRNGCERIKWEHHLFSELCDIVRGGSPRPAGDPKYYDGNIPFMKVADITNNASPYVSNAEYSIKEAGLKKTRMVDAYTLLLTNSGATLGVPAICTFKTTLNDGIAAFLGLDSESLLFYYYFWLSKTKELRGINKGAAQPNLNTNIIGSTEIDVPTQPERIEIARVLKEALDKESMILDIASQAIQNIDTMKKAILARAFRGELGTNDPLELPVDIGIS